MRQFGDLDICRARYRDSFPRTDLPTVSFGGGQSILFCRLPFTAQPLPAVPLRLGFQVQCLSRRTAHNYSLFRDLAGDAQLSSCFHPLPARLDLIPAQRCSLSTASIFSSLRIFQLLHPYPTHLVCSFASPPSTGTLSHSHSLFSYTSPRRLVTPLTRPHSHGTPRPALPPSAFAPLHGLSNGPTRMPPFTPGSPPPA